MTLGSRWPTEDIRLCPRVSGPAAALAACSLKALARSHKNWQFTLYIADTCHLSTVALSNEIHAACDQTAVLQQGLPALDVSSLRPQEPLEAVTTSEMLPDTPRLAVTVRLSSAVSELESRVRL